MNIDITLPDGSVKNYDHPITGTDIDGTSQQETIVGVNKYKPTEKQEINILSIDNDKVRKKQRSL